MFFVGFPSQCDACQCCYAAWYMAKRKFYMNQSFDQQLLPFLLKKYPEKFKVIGSSVMFLEVYKKEVAQAKLVIIKPGHEVLKLYEFNER